MFGKSLELHTFTVRYKSGSAEPFQSAWNFYIRKHQKTKFPYKEVAVINIFDFSVCRQNSNISYFSASYLEDAFWYLNFCSLYMLFCLPVWWNLWHLLLYCKSILETLEEEMEIVSLNIISSKKICAFLNTEHSNICTLQVKQKEWLWECASLSLGQTKLGVRLHD